MNSMIKAGILTASDRCFRGERRDESGMLLKSLVETLSMEVVAYRVFPDDEAVLKKALCHMADHLNCHIVLTTGGTGLGPRDHTPEATKAVMEKEVPGLAEAIRQQSIQQTPFAMLSRAVAGIRGRTLMINLPGSPGAVREAFDIIKPVLYHAAELIKGEVTDCHTSIRMSFEHSLKHASS